MTNHNFHSHKPFENLQMTCSHCMKLNDALFLLICTLDKGDNCIYLNNLFVHSTSYFKCLLSYIWLKFY